MEIIKTIKHKGYDIEIKQDENAELDWINDNEELFLVGYHRDFSVEKNDIITENEARAIFGKDKSDLSEYEQDRVKDIEKKYFTFGLEAYIHSGVVLALSYEGNFVDRQWDCSQLGLVLVEKKMAKNRKKAKKMAESLIENWNDSLMGNVYGYTIEDKEAEYDIDSCWGFLGDYDKSGLIEQAKDSIDYYIKNDRKKKLAEHKEAELKRITKEIKNYGFEKRIVKALR